MKLEQQVCSLELAKKLKELGVKQDSLFYWMPFNDGTADLQYEPEDGGTKEQSKALGFSAFTVAELGEILPMGARSFVCSHAEDMSFKDWTTEWERAEKWSFLSEKFANTEADARAKMLIYLIENNLITVT